MKKIYSKPEVELLKLNAIWAMCQVVASKSDEDATDDKPDFAPRRRTPAF